MLTVRTVLVDAYRAYLLFHYIHLVSALVTCKVFFLNQLFLCTKFDYFPFTYNQSSLISNFPFHSLLFHIRTKYY